VTWYFIYYRVAADRRIEAARLARGILAEVAAATGIAGSLMHNDGMDTWMEIYPAVADRGRFESALDGAVSRAQFLAVLGTDSRRQVERFVNAAAGSAAPPSCA
jgi:uncharacterized protein DUF4936